MAGVHEQAHDVVAAHVGEGLADDLLEVHEDGGGGGVHVVAAESEGDPLGLFVLHVNTSWVGSRI